MLFDMESTEGTYVAAERLRQVFRQVVVVTPRESLAQEASLAVRQGILRRFHRPGIETMVLAEPRWSEGFEVKGRLDIANVYTGQVRDIEEVAFFAYSTPRAPEVGLLAPLRAAGLEVHLIGDAKAGRAVMAATAEGYAVASAL